MLKPRNVGTISLDKILDTFLPPAMGFDDYFISGFPDVYMWIQENNSTNKDLVELLKSDEKLYREVYMRLDNKFTNTYYEKLCSIFLRSNGNFEVQ